MKISRDIRPQINVNLHEVYPQLQGWVYVRFCTITRPNPYPTGHVSKQQMWQKKWQQIIKENIEWTRVYLRWNPDINTISLHKDSSSKTQPIISIERQQFETISRIKNVTLLDDYLALEKKEGQLHNIQDDTSSTSKVTDAVKSAWLKQRYKLVQGDILNSRFTDIDGQLNFEIYFVSDRIDETEKWHDLFSRMVNERWNQIMKRSLSNASKVSPIRKPKSPIVKFVRQKTMKKTAATPMKLNIFKNLKQDNIAFESQGTSVFKTSNLQDDEEPERSHSGESNNTIVNILDTYGNLMSVDSSNKSSPKSADNQMILDFSLTQAEILCEVIEIQNQSNGILAQINQSGKYNFDDVRKMKADCFKLLQTCQQLSLLLKGQKDKKEIQQFLTSTYELKALLYQRLNVTNEVIIKFCQDTLIAIGHVRLTINQLDSLF